MVLCPPRPTLPQACLELFLALSIHIGACFLANPPPPPQPANKTQQDLSIIPQSDPGHPLLGYNMMI